jgi:hypothetical protein
MLLQDFQQKQKLLIFCWEWKLVALVHSANSIVGLIANFTLPDVIELGLPFTDPIADGPTIQKSNTVDTRTAKYI